MMPPSGVSQTPGRGGGFFHRLSLFHVRVTSPEMTAVACLCAGILQLVLFVVTPSVNRLYDGWPRGWLLHLVAVLAAFIAGVWPGLAAEAVGIAAIWSKGRYFTPMHPGLEVFAAIGLLQIFIIHQLQLAHRALRRREAALERARVQADDARRVAQAANSLKDQFLATLSHEMRTPLTVILGYCRLAREHGTERAGGMSAMATIERQAVIQLGVVEDLFEVQRLLDGDTRLEWGRVDLEAAMAEVVGTLQGWADGKRMTLALNVARVTVTGDAGAIRQIFRKLLSNALKFSAEGTRVFVSVQESGDQAVIRIENTGEPIPADFLPYLFEPFRQGDMSTTRAHGGLGLGLAIVKRLVDLHGGSIEAHTDERRTLFTVRLPQQQETKRRLAATG